MSLVPPQQEYTINYERNCCNSIHMPIRDVREDHTSVLIHHRLKYSLGYLPLYSPNKKIPILALVPKDNHLMTWQHWTHWVFDYLHMISESRMIQRLPRADQNDHWLITSLATFKPEERAPLDILSYPVHCRFPGLCPIIQLQLTESAPAVGLTRRWLHSSQIRRLHLFYGRILSNFISPGDVELFHHKRLMEIL